MKPKFRKLYGYIKTKKNTNVTFNAGFILLSSNKILRGNIFLNFMQLFKKIKDHYMTFVIKL